MEPATAYPMSHTSHGEQAGHKWLTYLAVGTALAAGALIISPYLLPALGISDWDTANSAFDVASSDNGLAGKINAILGVVPFIGSSLVKGGITAAVTSGAVGLGGLLLGYYVGKHEDGSHFIKWSKVIKTTALVTSALIALPAALTSISAGIIFLSAIVSNIKIATLVGKQLGWTLGGVAHLHGGTLGAGLGVQIAAHLPHLAAILAPIVSFGLWKKTASDDSMVTADILASAPTNPGVPCTLRMRLSDARTGQPITYDELARMHTRKLHLFVVDQSLQDYHHIHPEPIAEPGVYTFSFTPRTANSYSVWAEFAQIKDGITHRIKTDIPSAVRRNVSARVKPATYAEQGDIAVSWRSSEPLTQGEASIVSFNVTDKQGNPLHDLEPVMGAYAHLAGFSADGKTLIHTHPLGSEPMGEQERGGPALRFHMEPESSGPMQFYLQLKRGGQEIFVPFGQYIRPPERAVQKLHAHEGIMAAHAM